VGAEACAGSSTRNRADLALLCDAVKAAGIQALADQRAGVRHWLKGDGSPVSDADIAADAALADALRAARPDYGWVSEETGGTARDGRAFIVDPIDGTRAFLRGEHGWAVVAAVVDQGRPVSASVFCPARDLMFCAAAGAGAWSNGTRLMVSSHRSLRGATVTAPGGLWRDMGLGDCGVSRGGWVSSLALRLCRVADKGADVAITKPGAHHWDIAAADLVIREAGGTLTTLTGAPAQYDTDDTAHDIMIAGPSDLVAVLRQITARGRERGVL